MNIFYELKELVLSTIFQIFNLNTEKFAHQIVIEIPKDPLNGDLATNAAMILEKHIDLSSREVAVKLKENLKGISYIAHMEIAGPGFINFTLKSEKWQNCLKEILDKKLQYGIADIGKGKRINIEYVSCNPTGPMHVGHTRGAIYGDVLASLLNKCGFVVTKEFYINDAGTQVDKLAETVYLRYKSILNNEKEVKIPDGLYPGQYLIPVAEKLVNQYQNKLLSYSETERNKIVRNFAINEMMSLIRHDLELLGIKHDIFFSEQNLHEQNKIQNIVDQLTARNLVYQGSIPPPKGKKFDNWEIKEQLLFNSTKYGDDQDRPLQKNNKEWSYFAAEIAYIADKINRNYDHLIFVLGADHGGYINRLKAAVKAIGDEKVSSVVKICQLVNYSENGVPITMSKRAGNFVTVQDIINSVGKDIVRFMMITRKNDSSLDFDFTKVKEVSKDNPVFYVQYAHVRAISIIQNAAQYSPISYEKLINEKISFELLNTEEELFLIKLLASWPKVIEAAITHFEPHRIAFYLQDLSAGFHSLWNLGKDKSEYKFVTDNENITTSRLALAKAVKIVLQIGLEIIGITPLQKM